MPVEKSSTSKRSEAGLILETEEGGMCLGGRDVEEVVELRRQGLSVCAISRLTRYDRKTINRYLRGPSSRPVYGPRAAADSKLVAFKPHLRGRLQAGVWNAMGAAA